MRHWWPLLRRVRSSRSRFRSPTRLAAGMRVPAAIGDFLVIRSVRESGGTAVTVSDEEMVDGMVEMARTGGSVRGS